MPVDVMIGLPQDQPMTEIEFVKKMQKKLTYAYELARTNLCRAAERQAKYYNQKCHGSSFQIGDLCWYANKLCKKGISPKLQLKWPGPCLVVKRFSDMMVCIQLTAKKTINVHVDLLKECYSPDMELPSWLRRMHRALLKGSEQFTFSTEKCDRPTSYIIIMNHHFMLLTHV